MEDVVGTKPYTLIVVLASFVITASRETIAFVEHLAITSNGPLEIMV